jgi:3-deoxy-manno-octulosonate cytidylyltransferase (CMP-KDO synthetase)
MSRRVAIVIPARYASARFPGKPLTALAGADGARKSLIRRCWEAAERVCGVTRILVATDDDRIADHARGFGAEVVMTPASCRNGTERCAAALSSLSGSVDLVINLQGDAPLTPPDFVEALIVATEADDAAVATPAMRCDGPTLERFREDRRAGRVGGTTVVFGHDRRALYFSKEIVPIADMVAARDPSPVFHHVGLYAYRPDLLERYLRWEPGPLERVEGLEQLRFLENGAPVRCVEVDAAGRDFWEVNNPVDVARVEAALAVAGLK